MFEAHFQTFEEPESGVALAARLAAFREELARRKLTGFVIPRADQQQNEYVAASEERLAWLTGFTGSAGMAIVLTREAAVFVDGDKPLCAEEIHQIDGDYFHAGLSRLYIYCLNGDQASLLKQVPAELSGHVELRSARDVSGGISLIN
jgi:Xaa-Pro aminopeptidase